MLYPIIFSNVPELPVMALVVPNFDDFKYLDVNDSGLIAKDLFGTFIAYSPNTMSTMRYYFFCGILRFLGIVSVFSASGLNILRIPSAAKYVNFILRSLSPCIFSTIVLSATFESFV